MKPLPAGIYDRLIDRDTRELLEAHLELRSVLKKIDAEEVPARFAAFIADVMEKALQLHESTENRLKLCNEIIGHISASEATAHLDGRHLIGEVRNVLWQVLGGNVQDPPHFLERSRHRPSHRRSLRP